MEKQQKEVDIFKRIAILTSIVFFSILFIALIPCIIFGIIWHDWTYTYAWLVCLGPCSIFVLISAFLPIEKIFTLHKKQLIFGWSLFYVIKYATLFSVSIICVIYASSIFNKWVILALTLFTPIMVFIMKMFTTYSKKNKIAKKQTTNTIKF